MEKLFHIVADIAEKYNIKIFLQFGTLLGQQRNNNLICYDYDVDVGILSNDFNILSRELKKKVNSDIYSVVVTDFFLSRKIEIIHIKSHITIDIISYKEIENGIIQRDLNYFLFLYLSYILNQCNKRDIPKEWLLPLRPVSFLGKKVYIPNNPQAFLICEYGSNYLTPDHKCNHDCSKCEKI
jgi:phosphorylcholine metabolism protein LicD